MKTIPVNFTPRHVFRFFRRHVNYQPPAWMDIYATVQERIIDRQNKAVLSNAPISFFKWSLVECVLHASLTFMAVGMLYGIWRLAQILF